MSRKKLPAISSEGPTGDKAPRTIEYKVGSIDASGVREDRLVPVQLMVTKTTHTKVAASPKHPATIDLEPADQSRPPTEMEAPVPSARQLRCSECGEIAEAACDCGAPYLPAGARAAEAIAKHPEKSDRAIAAEAGVNRRTVVRARKQLVHSAPVAEQRIGKDGKRRRVPAKSPEPELGPEAGNGAEPLMATLPSDIRKDSITEALSPPQPKISKSPPAEAAPPQPIKSTADRIKAILKGWLPLLNEDGLIEAEKDIAKIFEDERARRGVSIMAAAKMDPSRLN
jgi:hypothetical protein